MLELQLPGLAAEAMPAPRSKITVKARGLPARKRAEVSEILYCLRPDGFWSVHLYYGLIKPWRTPV